MTKNWIQDAQTKNRVSKTNSGFKSTGIEETTMVRDVARPLTLFVRRDRECDSRME